MRLSLLVVTLVSATSALAAPSPYKRSLTLAAEALESSRAQANRAHFMCREAIGPAIDAAVESVDGLRNGAQEHEITAIKMNLGGLSMTASMSGCPMSVAEDIARATESLEDARRILFSTRPPDTGPKKRRDDDDGQPAPVMAYASMLPVKVQPTSVWNQEASVRLTVPELTLANMKGQLFYMGVRYRSYEGQWSQWVTTQQWSVPNNNFVWKNAFNHFLPYSALAEEDFSGGRFVARISVFDSQGRELTYRDTTFRVRLPQLPERPQPLPLPPGVVVPPPVVVVPTRDCGIAGDPGCMMWRDRQLPMEAPSFNGFVTSMRTNNSEMMRTEILGTLLQRNYLTAAQLGVMLDLINSEMTRLYMAQTAAPRVVDPQNAQALSTKFRSSMNAGAFSQMMAQQPNGTVAPQFQTQMPVPVPVYQQQPPPLPLPPQNSRECAGSDDPACGMTRTGQMVMAPASFAEFTASLRRTMNDITREEMALNVFSKTVLSAKQYGIVMDLFSNELTKLEVAKRLAGQVINPQAALGFGSKFQNSILASEYTQAIAGR